MYVYKKYKYFYAQTYYKYIVLHLLFIQTKKKKSGRSKKMDIYFCPFLKTSMENFIFLSKKWFCSKML
jgi:hypothetical protein